MANVYQQWHVVLSWKEPDGLETTGVCMPFVPTHVGQAGAIDRACETLAVDLTECTVTVTAIGDPCDRPPGAA